MHACLRGDLGYGACRQVGERGAHVADRSCGSDDCQQEYPLARLESKEMGYETYRNDDKICVPVVPAELEKQKTPAEAGVYVSGSEGGN